MESKPSQRYWFQSKCCLSFWLLWNRIFRDKSIFSFVLSLFILFSKGQVSTYSISLELIGCRDKRIGFLFDWISSNQLRERIIFFLPGCYNDQIIIDVTLFPMITIRRSSEKWERQKRWLQFSRLKPIQEMTPILTLIWPFHSDFHEMNLTSLCFICSVLICFRTFTIKVKADWGNKDNKKNKKKIKKNETKQKIIEIFWNWNSNGLSCYWHWDVRRRKTWWKEMPMWAMEWHTINWTA